MSFFVKGRNTTGVTGTADVAGPTHQRVHVRPHAGVLQTHTPLPPAQRLDARVGSLSDSAFAVERAKDYVAQCERPVKFHPGAIKARPGGRASRFVKSALDKMGACVGVGRGPTPFVEQSWARPDEPPPTKLKSSSTLFQRPTFTLSKEQKAVRAQAQESALRDAALRMGEVKVDFRSAVERETLLVSKSKQVDAVKEMLHAGVLQARQEHVDRLTTAIQCQQKHQAAVERVSDCERQLNVVLKGQGHLANELKQVAVEHQVLTERQTSLKSAYDALGPQAKDGEIRKMVVVPFKTRNLLVKNEFILAHRKTQLETAQRALDAANVELKYRTPIWKTAARNTAKAKVQACQAKVEEAKGKLERQIGCVEKAQSHMARAQQKWTEVKACDKNRIQGLAIREEFHQNAQSLRDLQRRSDALLEDFGGHENALVAAKTELTAAKEDEAVSRIDMQTAQRKAEASRQRAVELEHELPRLQPLQEALEGPVHEARLEADKARAADQRRVADRVSELVKHPPGFPPAQVTRELREQMQNLANRIEAVSPWLNETQAAADRETRMPVDQTLEIVCRCAAMATGGKGDDAAKALKELMERPFCSLVPKPDENFVGHAEALSNPGDDNTPLKRTISAIAARPRGIELMLRTTQISPEADSQQIRDAVAVYLKASNTNNSLQTPDRDSAIWLQQAEFAAKVLVHADKQEGDEAALAGLTRLQRVAFNGVRNGFTSVAPNSPYDKANKALKEFTDQWVTGAVNNTKKASPLNARALGTQVAADVQLPTLETNLNTQLKKACDELLKITANELNDARSVVGSQRQKRALESAGAGGTEPTELAQVPHALLQAQALLHHVSAKAESGERIDTLTLGTKSWRAIEKSTNAKVKQEATAVKNGGGALGEITQKMRADKPVDETALPMKDFGSLQLTLQALQDGKPNVMQALLRLRDELQPRSPSATVSGPVGPDSPSASSEASQPASPSAKSEFSEPDITTTPTAEDEAMFAEWLHSNDNANVLPISEEDHAELQDFAEKYGIQLQENRIFDPMSSVPQQGASDDRPIDASQQATDFTDIDADLQRRLNALRDVPIATPAASVNGDPDDIDDVILYAPPARLHGDPNDLTEAMMDRLASAEWTEVQPQPEVQGAPGASSSGAGRQAYVNSEIEVAPDVGPRAAALGQIRTAQPVPSQLGTGPSAQGATTPVASESAQPSEPLTPLDDALAQAKTLHERAERFRSSKGDFSSEALEQWVTPSVTDSFGAVTLRHGKQVGIGTGGITGIASKISATFGLVIRPDAELTLNRTDQMKFGRDARGIELSLGRTRGISGAVRAIGRLVAPAGLTGVGPGVGIDHNASLTKGKDGFLMRAPKFGDKTHKMLTGDFSKMVSTALTWREPRQENGDPLYEEPLEALLDRHADISVGTIHSSRVVSHTATSTVQAFSSPGGEVGKGASNLNIFAGLSSSRTTERSSLTQQGGTQAAIIDSRKSTHLVSANAGFNVQFSGMPGQQDKKPEDKEAKDKDAEKAAEKEKKTNYPTVEVAQLRGRALHGLATANLRLSSAQSGANLLLRPDGTIGADRFLEFNSFRKFEAKVAEHREKWVLKGMKDLELPEGFPEAEKRIIAERTLDDFMAHARASEKAGQVTFQENLDVKPEVSSQLSGNLALEEIARLEGRVEDANHLAAAREKILADDSSYVPFLLKAIVRSSATESNGINLGLSYMHNKGATASQIYDWYPKVGSAGPDTQDKPLINVRAPGDWK